MTRTPRPKKPRSDLTVHALHLFAEILLDDHFMDRARQKESAAILRGAGMEPGAEVELAVYDFAPDSHAGLFMMVKAPEIIVRVQNPKFSAEILCVYDFKSTTLRDARIVYFDGDRKEARTRVDQWSRDLAHEMFEDIDFDESSSPEDDPGEPPPASAEDKAMVEALAASMARDMKRKKPDIRAHAGALKALEHAPQTIWPILDGTIAAHAAEPRDDALIGAWLFILESQLTMIRYRIDAGWDWAVKMAKQAQQKIIQAAEDNQISAVDLAAISATLGEARIPTTEDDRIALAEAGADQSDDRTPDEMRAVLHQLMDQMAGAVSSPFEAVGVFDESARVMPNALRCFMAHEFALSPHAVFRDAVPLMLLTEHREVRAAAAAALARTAAPDTMSPAALRRMIAIRAWLPEADRPAVDQAIRDARMKGVECAPWPPAQGFTVTASFIDGSGAQSIVLTTPGKSKGVLGGILIKLREGIADSWCDQDVPRRNINRTLAELRTIAQEVTRPFLDLIVQNALAIGAATGNPPKTSLLEIAELAGGADWHARRIDIAAEARTLFGELPDAARTPAAIQAALTRAGKWMELPLAKSWFLDSPEVRALIRQTPARHAAMRLMTDAMPKHRDEWAEQFLLLALAARAAVVTKDANWANDLTVMAYCLSGDRDLADIPLMVRIAAYTIEVSRMARW